MTKAIITVTLLPFLDTQHCLERNPCPPQKKERKKEIGVQEDGLDLDPVPIMPTYKGDLSSYK